MRRISLLLLLLLVASNVFAAEAGGSKVLPERLREASGRVLCPGIPKFDRPVEAEGFLFGNAQEQFVLTTSRVLIADDGTPRMPLKRCTFTSHGSDRRPIYLSGTIDPSNYAFGGFDHVDHGENDFAIVRLATTLAITEPFRFEAYPVELGVPSGRVLFALTSDGKNVFLQSCAAEGVTTGSREHPEVATHNCTLPPGETSGLALAVRKGRLVPVGLISSPRTILGLSDRVLDLAQRVMGASF